MRGKPLIIECVMKLLECCHGYRGRRKKMVPGCADVITVTVVKPVRSATVDFTMTLPAVSVRM